MMDVREERRPLAPQFSLRWMLGVTTVCAFLFAIVGMAVQGHGWAIGISAGLGTIALMMIIYAILFAVIWTMGNLVPHRRPDLGQCPFRAEAVHSTDMDHDTPTDAEILP